VAYNQVGYGCGGALIECYFALWFKNSANAVDKVLHRQSGRYTLEVSHQK